MIIQHPLPVKQENGINWDRAYYPTEEDARDVHRQIHEGTNTTHGHARASVEPPCESDPLWSVHYHYDNTINPDFHLREE